MRTAELTQPLASCSTLESSPVHRPGSTVEQALVAGVVGNLPKGLSMGELALPFVSCGVTRMRERYPSPPLSLTTCGRLDTWPWDLEAQGASLRQPLVPHRLQHLGERALHRSPAPVLGSTGQPQGHGVAEPALSLCPLLAVALDGPAMAGAGELPPVVCCSEYR